MKNWFIAFGVTIVACVFCGVFIYGLIHAQLAVRVAVACIVFGVSVGSIKALLDD